MRKGTLDTVTVCQEDDKDGEEEDDCGDDDDDIDDDEYLDDLREESRHIVESLDVDQWVSIFYEDPEPNWYPGCVQKVLRPNITSTQ